MENSMLCNETPTQLLGSVADEGGRQRITKLFARGAQCAASTPAQNQTPGRANQRTAGTFANERGWREKLFRMSNHRVTGSLCLAVGGACSVTGCLQLPLHCEDFRRPRISQCRRLQEIVHSAAGQQGCVPGNLDSVTQHTITIGNRTTATSSCHFLCSECLGQEVGIGTTTETSVTGWASVSVRLVALL